MHMISIKEKGKKFKLIILVLTYFLVVVQCYLLQVQAFRHTSSKGPTKESDAQVKTLFHFTASEKRISYLPLALLKPSIISKFEFIFPYSSVIPSLPTFTRFPNT